MTKYLSYCALCLLTVFFLHNTAAMGVTPSPSSIPEPTPVPAPTPPPGTIRVTILSNLEKPVSGVRVSVFRLRGPDGEELSPCDGYEEIALEAKSETLFEKDLSPGPYRVEASAPGWIGEAIEQVEMKEGEVRELTIKLQPGQRIAGRVEDGEGGSLAGVEIDYWSSSGMDTGPSLYLVERKSVTNSDGRFDLNELREGVYSVTASREGYIKNTRDDVATGTDNLLMVLRKGYVITGVLQGDLEDLGSPVRLDFKKGKWGSFSRSVDLDPENSFSVSDLERGSYNIRIKSGDYISDWAVNIPVVSENRPVPVVLTVYRGASISGRVVDGKTNIPLENVRVDLDPVNGTRGDIDTTDEEGMYEFKALPAGNYRLAARLGYEPWRKKRVEKEISLASGEKLTGIDLELDPGRRITVNGLVVDGDGRPVSGAKIREHFRLPGEEMFTSNYRGNLLSDESGAFSMEILVPKDAEIKLEAEKKGFAPSRDENVPLSSGRDRVEGIVLQMSSGADLAVEVEDEEGGAIPGAVVSLTTDWDWSARKETPFRFLEKKKLSDSRGRMPFR